MASDNSTQTIIFDHDDELSLFTVLRQIHRVYQFSNPSSGYRYENFDKSWKQLVDALEHYYVYMEDDNRRGLNLKSSFHIPNLLIEDLVIKSASNIETILKESITVKLDEIIPNASQVDIRVNPDFSDTELFKSFQKALSLAYSKILPLGANPSYRKIGDLLSEIDTSRKRKFSYEFNRIFLQGNEGAFNALDSLVILRNKIAHNLKRDSVNPILIPLIVWNSFEVSRLIFSVVSQEDYESTLEFSPLSDLSGAAYEKSVLVMSYEI